MEIPIEYKDQIIMIKRDRGEHDNYFFDSKGEKIIEV